MARRGLANYDPPGDTQNDHRWWRELYSKDGCPDASFMINCQPSKDNWYGKETTRQASDQQPWRTRPGEPAEPVLAAAVTATGRAGKSSWHYDVRKPLGRNVDVCFAASASFFAAKPPHLTVEGPLTHAGAPGMAAPSVAASSAARPGVAGGGAEKGRSPRPAAAGASPRPRNAGTATQAAYTATSLGFRGTFFPRLA
eukprot:TRINITY_DN47856_c0_g1_i1.p1 TRINITY_DN47856_c0_g1~~TRINITY_DN47856_c0_g1_i1.p1  ORF type:complete len:210 (-),score=33.71 TRINITY_DN47856_c0_g1_i1:56-649(-)